MSKDQTEAESERGNDPEQPRRSGLARLRAQPGFRTAVIAFVLTVVLGIGGTAAYAYWSQSAAVTIKATTRSDLPANTTLIGAQPVLAARPGLPSFGQCKPKLTGQYADMTFDWSDVDRANSYLITVKSTNPGYAFADITTKSDTKTVSAATASFRFPRTPSRPAKGEDPAYYTEYVIRVLPMNGTVAGDPLYFSFLYSYDTNACWSGADLSHFTGGSPFPPLGSAGEVQCAPLAGTGSGGYSDLGVSWARADKATSYSVRIVNPAGYGAETSVSTTSTTFRVPRVSPESETEPYFGQYIVRVQPMNGAVAGDPVYKTLQLGKWSQECW